MINYNELNNWRSYLGMECHDPMTRKFQSDGVSWATKMRMQVYISRWLGSLVYREELRHILISDWYIWIY